MPVLKNIKNTAVFKIKNNFGYIDANNIRILLATTFGRIH